MAIKLKVQETKVKLKSADADAVHFTPSVGIPIYPNPYTGSTEVTPTEEAQTLSTNGLMMPDDVKVGAIDSEYVGSSVLRQTELSVSGKTVTAAAGYYEEALSETVSVELQEKTRNIGASGTYEETPDDGYDGLSKVTTEVPSGSLSANAEAGYTTISDARKWRFRPVTNVGTAGFFQRGNHYGSYATYDAIPTGTSVTPSTSSQTIGGANTMMEGAVTVNAMPTGSEGTPVATKSAVSNHSVTITPSVTNTEGYIEGGTKTGTGVSVSASELVSGTLNVTSSGTKDVTNYASASVPSGTIGNPNMVRTKEDGYLFETITYPNFTEGYISSVSPLQLHLALEDKSATPTTSTQTITPTGNSYYLDRVTVNPIPSEYIVPSGTKNITSNGQSIDVKAYEYADVAVPSGQPTLETVTKTYTPTTSQQTETITPSSGYDGIGEVDVTVNAMPTMTLPSNPDPTTPSGTKKATINYQVTADRYLNIPTGYNGTAQYYEIKGVPNGTVTAPSTITATGATSSVSIANQTITLTKAVSVTPSVTTAGYVSSGTAGNASVSLTASDITFRESDSLIVNGKEVTAPVGYYPAHAYASVADGTAGTPIATKGSVSNHTISVTPSVTNTTGYITGSTKTGTAVTVSASELVSGSETKTANGTYNVTNLAEIVVNVSGGGGTSKNTQVVQGTTRTTKSAMTAIGAEMTVSKTGTYDVYWSAFRSSTSTSYTYATQLYIDGSAHGSENSTWSNHVQDNHLTGVSLTVNQKIRVYGRESRNSSYYIYAPTLVIVEQ